MKNLFILTIIVFSFLSHANDVCEMMFKVRYPGKLTKVATKTAAENYSKLSKSVKSLETKEVKIAFGKKQTTPTKYLQEIRKHYTGKNVTASYKPKDHFDEIDDVYNAVKEMPEEVVVKKLQESMKRYSEGYKASMGTDLKIPGVDADYDGQTLNSLFQKAIKGDASDFNKYIDNFLVTDPNTNKLDLLRAELMSWYGQEMDMFYEPLINQVKRKASTSTDNGVTVTKKQISEWKKRADYIEEVKEAKFKISRAINRLESFQNSQVKRVGMDDFVMTRNGNLDKLTYLELSDYETYSRSLIYDLSNNGSLKRVNGKEFKLPTKDAGHKDIKKMYSDLDEGNLGILSIEEYRDIVSKNAFPMFVKRHDMRHVHYALSHPRALGAVMGATRSQNHLRFTQLGGMYEAIETVQYGFEQSIAQYFSRKIDQNTFMMMKRNLDLEESMLTLATTPRVFSYGIGEAHGYGYHWRDSVKSLKGWALKRW